ncbi:hypothetical protein [Macrococcoides canis]|uniref:hypothetical protein n=1 Tax=Macrococcoides canis TaxID=1855823 RepID=UPI00165EB852|nr:hypothetical protein [Macrococcus canis]QNR07783.1 hypothetical protein GL258_05770 [Macrococcus canis]UTH07928.1 hypothetical protein KFV07_05815 [Macrococcus canis]
MHKNSLGDLNAYLFEQLERLNDPELTREEILLEISRSKAIADVGKTIIENAGVVLEAQKFFDERLDIDAEMPKMLEG